MIIKVDQQDKLKAVKQHHLPMALQPRPKPVKPKKAAPAKPQIDETKLQLEQSLQRIAALEAELATEREAKFKEGFEAGKQEGYAKGLAEVKAEIQKFAELTSDLHSRQENLLSRAKEFVIQFTFQIVKRLVGTEAFQSLRLDKTQLMQMVEEVVERFADAPRLTFRLHRESVPVLEANREHISAQLPDGMNITVLEDPSLNASDCVIETDFGALDSCIETRLQQIERYFEKL